jgi:hypothetical protein
MPVTEDREMEGMGSGVLAVRYRRVYAAARQVQAESWKGREAF